MNGKAHMAVSVSSLLLFRPDFNIRTGDAAFVVGTLIGSILPDCDTKQSIAGRFLPIWLVTRHRGITHSLLALAGVYMIGVFANGMFGIPPTFWPGLSYGYATHLVLDIPGGLPNLFYPLIKRKRRRAY